MHQLIPSRHLLGPSEVFACGDYIGRSKVEALTVAPTVITSEDFFEPIDTINEHLDAAEVNQAITAISGLHRLIWEKSTHRVTVLETFHEDDWHKSTIQTLRDAIYTMVGSTLANPQAVRDDIADGEPNGIFIVKGQANPKTPLFIVEKPTPAGRRMEVIDGRPLYGDEIMQEVNAFSPRELTHVERYVDLWARSEVEVKRRVFEYANRYTTPTIDALYGAYWHESYGPGMLSGMTPEMSLYQERRGVIPE